MRPLSLLKHSARELMGAIAAVVLVTPTFAQTSAEPLPGGGAIERLTAPACACPCPVEPTPAPPSFGGPIHERAKFSGDWLGVRPALRDRGLTFDVSTTQFYQGLTTGGLEQSFPYGGRNDYFLNVNGEQLGLWKGLFVTLHGETRYGESPNLLTGALSPVNMYLAVPAAEGTASGLTALKVSQFVTENVLVYAGRINNLDDVRQPLTGATGFEGFWNMAFIFNPVMSRTLPYSTFGAGVAYLQNLQTVAALVVMDTNDTPTTSGFDTFFNNGVSILGMLNLPTRFLGRPGHQGIMGTYSTGRYTNLQPSSYLDPVDGLVVPSAPKQGSWCVTYNFDQALWVSPNDEKRMWGVFGQFGIADNNPNPIQWFASAGVSGASPIPGRTRDTFGVGYFYVGVSGPLKESSRPTTPLGNEQGVELYYNARLTPWFQITPDLQVIDPFQKQAGTALLVGLRARIDF